MSSPLPTLLAQGFRVLPFREGMWGEASRLRQSVQTSDKAQGAGEPETQSGTEREGPPGDAQWRVGGVSWHLGTPSQSGAFLWVGLSSYNGPPAQAPLL